MTAAAVPADDWTPAPTDEPRVLRLVEAPEEPEDDHIVLGYN